jgi:hypothetical protein
MATQRQRLERPLPRPGARDTARGPQRARLRPTQLPQAPARGLGRRSAQLRTLVRRLVATSSTGGWRLRGRCAANLARGHRLAARRWADRPAGIARLTGPRIHPGAVVW